MHSYTFDSDRLLNSALRDVYLKRQYTTSTAKHGPFSRPPTLLEAAASGAKATIDWKARTFEIGGTLQAVDGLKKKTSSFSGTRYWRWGEGEEYKVRYGDNMWIISSSDSADPIATLTSATAHVFKANPLPVLKIAQSLRVEEQRQFLILVLLYSETKRLDRQD
ncbi:hypothetical protein MKEN_00642800 [Mycena kentingensis (nom. inval.)]|nr:hypothetical protein MKEN_00642800 [Mycena kentingensis (nom. inval.)]